MHYHISFKALSCVNILLYIKIYITFLAHFLPFFYWAFSCFVLNPGPGRIRFLQETARFESFFRSEFEVLANAQPDLVNRTNAIEWRFSIVNIISNIIWTKNTQILQFFRLSMRIDNYWYCTKAITERGLASSLFAIKLFNAK